MRCIALFCKETALVDSIGHEILCRHHYSLAPGRLRRRAAKLKRAALRASEARDWARSSRAHDLYIEAFRRMRSAAEEAALKPFGDRFKVVTVRL